MSELEQSVAVYRAITGGFANKPIGQIFQGVTDRQLAQDGIFVGNSTSSQLGSTDLFNPLEIYVPGLPVFLNKEEAEYWIINKKFQHPPVIVQANIPLSKFFGDIPELRIGRNAFEETFHEKPFYRDLTPEELLRHIRGLRIIKGECSITAASTLIIPMHLLRGNERFYRPILNEEGWVTKEAEWQEVFIK